jgi:diguanylate cyclase (GGDEF)-like protein
MSVDIIKQLERAKRYIEKNQIDDAIEAYQSVLTAAPNHMESIQALGDLHTRQNQPDRAAQYYGMLFDRFTAPRDEAKALAVYGRFLKPHQQPPERVARYALLLQKANRSEEAIEQFMSAAMAFDLSGKGDDALACFIRITQLDPENYDRHIAVAELAERSGNMAAAAKGFLRAGQLKSSDDAEALPLFARAHRLMPNDRSAALLYAQCLLRGGNPAAAADLLTPLAATETDTKFLETYAESLMRAVRLDEARTVLERMTNQGAGSAERFFGLVHEYLRAGKEQGAVDLLGNIKKSMLAARRESEFASAVDQMTMAFPKSVPLSEFRAAMYAELNRETKYFDALVQLFDLYLESDHISEASQTLEKLVDIDPYDSRNQHRMDLLRGLADDTFLTQLRSRLSNAATHGSQPSIQEAKQTAKNGPLPALLEEIRADQTLEDLLVQAEIFIQYSLQSKAIERLQKIVELFPGEREHNERLQSLIEAAHWRVEDQPSRPKPARPAVAPPPEQSAGYAPETLRDLAKISEINQNVFRQPTPRAMLSVVVNEVGNYFHAARCLAVVGPPGQSPQMASEFCAPGVEVSAGATIVRLIGQIEHATPDALGGLPLSAADSPALREMGLETVLAVQLNDPETQTPAGMLIACFATPRSSKPNETYFLQSIGDQMMLCVHHTRLRSLSRTIAVADEKTGLLTRASYIDCLLHESQLARKQGVPLTLALLQVDGGPDLLRQQGEAPFERYMEQLGRAVQTIVRQTDLAVKYTSWALAFILPDTSLTGARSLAEKLKKAAANLRTPWDGSPVTLSISVAEAIVQQDFDHEDIVTDLINRAEAGLEEARKLGGNEIISLESARV